MIFYAAGYSCFLTIAPVYGAKATASSPATQSDATSCSHTAAGRRSISEMEIKLETRISIHPCFWRTLGIQERETK